MLTSIVLFGAVGASAEGSGASPAIRVETVEAKVGDDIEVNVFIDNNPGIAGMQLNVFYDADVLTYKGVEYAEEWGGSGIPPQKASNPFILLWYNFSDYSGSGVFATLSFSVADDSPNTVSEIKITYNAGDVSNQKFDDVDLAVVNGKVYITGNMPDVPIESDVFGDINGDGVLDFADVIRLLLFELNLNVKTNERAPDMNGDGKNTLADVVFLAIYLIKRLAE